MLVLIAVLTVVFGLYIGVEALDRWIDRVGTLPPDEELGLDEETSDDDPKGAP